MKRLNPLYIVLLFITILFISYWQLNNVKEEFASKNSEFENIQIKAKEYTSLKSQWSNKEYASKTINQIIKNKLYSTEKVLIAEVGNSIKVKVQSTNSKVLEDFLNKVLNKPLNIKNLNMTKDFISLEVSVK